MTFLFGIFQQLGAALVGLFTKRAIEEIEKAGKKKRRRIPKNRPKSYKEKRRGNLGTKAG